VGNNHIRYKVSLANKLAPIDAQQIQEFWAGLDESFRTVLGNTFQHDIQELSQQKLVLFSKAKNEHFPRHMASVPIFDWLNALFKEELPQRPDPVRILIDFIDGAAKEGKEAARDFLFKFGRGRFSELRVAAALSEIKNTMMQQFSLKNFSFEVSEPESHLDYGGTDITVRLAKSGNEEKTIHLQVKSSNPKDVYAKGIVQIQDVMKRKFSNIKSQLTKVIESQLSSKDPVSQPA
jgi:hypothetical protein